MLRSGLLSSMVLAFTASLPAHGQQDIDCGNAMTQMEMTFCAQKDWQEADAELNAAYQSAMAAMKETDGYLTDDLKGAATALRDAQRAWISFRDKACESYGFLARGGSMEPMLVYGCRADLTRRRTSELKSLSEGLGN